MAATEAAAKTTTNTTDESWLETHPYPRIFYDEPEPEDRLQQFPALFRVVALLYELFMDRPDVFSTGGGFIFYDETNGNRRVAPDFLITFDVDSAWIWANLPNYLIWKIGKPPHFVMEVASPSTAANDLGRKRDLYERLGVQEYWRFDATGGDHYGEPMAGERLVDGIYQPYEISVDEDGSIRGYSELLDLVFFWDGNKFSEFDVLDPETGITIEKSVIAETERDAAEARTAAEREARLAEQEARLAAEARERALLEEIARLRQQQTNA